MRRVLAPWRAAVIVAMAASIFVTGVQPAFAHDRPDEHMFWAVRNTGGSLCVFAEGYQNHAYHHLKTTTYKRAWYAGDCGVGSNRPGGNIAHYAEFYTDGYGPCYRWPGWKYNPGPESMGMISREYYDVWFRGCGYTPGAHTYITMDSWHYAWNPNEGRWVGNFARPITGHCHCP